MTITTIDWGWLCHRALEAQFAAHHWGMSGGELFDKTAPAFGFVIVAPRLGWRNVGILVARDDAGYGFSLWTPEGLQRWENALWIPVLTNASGVARERCDFDVMARAVFEEHRETIEASGQRCVVGA